MILHCCLNIFVWKTNFSLYCPFYDQNHWHRRTVVVLFLSDQGCWCFWEEKVRKASEVHFNLEMHVNLNRFTMLLLKQCRTEVYRAWNWKKSETTNGAIGLYRKWLSAQPSELRGVAGIKKYMQLSSQTFFFILSASQEALTSGLK